MTKISLFILFILTSVAVLCADTITLSSGETLEGQLLRVANKALIFEVIHDSSRVITISIDRESVISVIDESQDVLYSNGLLREDPEDYYQKVYLPIFYRSTQKDTIIFKNGKKVIGDIIYTKGSYILYKRSFSPTSETFSIKAEQIYSINGMIIQSDVILSDPYNAPPINKVFHYPHTTVEFGVTVIKHHLNEYQSIVDDLVENNENINQKALRKINDPLIALNLGFDFKFSPSMGITFIGNFMLNYSDNEDYLHDVESYRLFLGEINYTYPLKSFSPWIGLGYALQSITLINRYSGVDIKYKSQSKSYSAALGVILRATDRFGGIFSIRYLPFGTQDIIMPDNVEFQSQPSINLTNILFSGSVFLDL